VGILPELEVFATAEMWSTSCCWETMRWSWWTESERFQSDARVVLCRTDAMVSVASWLPSLCRGEGTAVGESAG
jgi:hypothetical protein